MRLVICGQKKFGLEVLKLCERMGFTIAAIVVPTMDATLRLYAENAGYPIAPTAEIANKWFQQYPDHSFDLGICAHTFEYIPESTRLRARIGWLGYHPSLLPRHRGRSSIEWAMRVKDPITGGTLYWLNEKWDEGDISYQDWIFLDHDKTIKEVWDQELMPMGVRLFQMALDDLKAGKIILRKPQGPLAKFATYEPPAEVKKKFDHAGWDSRIDEARKSRAEYERSKE